MTLLYDEVDTETEEIIGGGMIELTETTTTIRVPYYEDAKEINIYDKSIEKKLTIDVSAYAKAPEAKEAPEEITELKEKEEEKKPVSTMAYIFGIILLLIVIFAIIILFKAKRTRA